MSRSRSLVVALLTTLLAVTAVSARPPQRLYHGTAYYPELWPDAELARDIAEMKKLGINVARIGEFAWSKMEPDEGAIDFAYFRHVMDALHAAGIRVVLCTPTATPPIWLTHGHPERMHVNADGEVMVHGARQHVCYEHPEVQRYSYRIVEAMARELGRHPALLAWQIDNELKCHVAEDFNPATVAQWHVWLEKNYGTIAALNEAWGTEIWSQRYQRFDQVPAPRLTPFLHNASLSTAYRLFSRESIAAFSDAQAALLRQHSAAPITTNSNVGFAVSQERLFQHLDFAAWDAYPSSTAWIRNVLDSDLYRGVRPGVPFWFMETSVAHNGWLTNHEPAHPPGFLVSEAVLTYALGGEAISYWLWRQQRTGCELPHSAVLNAWGTPSIGYAEAVKVEAARRALEPLLTTSEPAGAEIGLTWSDRGRVMLQVEPLGGRPTHAVTHDDLFGRWHRLMVEQGYHRDIRFEGASLDGLKILVTPAMMAVSDAFLARLQPWIEAGGIWITGNVTGTRTTEHTAHTTAGLGALDALGGVETVFGYPVTQTGARGEAFGLNAELAGWALPLRPTSPDTQVLGTVRSAGADHGLAFLTERRLGRGKVVLFTADPRDAAGQQIRAQLLARYAAEAGLQLRFTVSPGSLVAPRVTTDGGTLWIVINLDGRGGRVTLPQAATDAVSGAALPAGELRLDNYDWRAVRF